MIADPPAPTGQPPTPTEPDPDETLKAWVDAAIAGDEAAFSAIYRLFAARIYRFCLVRVGCAADAEDLVQKTFLRVVEALPGYEDRGLPFGAWVFRIARNALIDDVRQHRDHTELWALGAVLGDMPERDLATVTADRDAIRRALARLTRDQREVIEYRFFGDLTARETARLMGRSEAAVRVLQARAIAALRRLLPIDEPASPPPAATSLPITMGAPEATRGPGPVPVLSVVAT